MSRRRPQAEPRRAASGWRARLRSAGKRFWGGVAALGIGGIVVGYFVNQALQSGTQAVQQALFRKGPLIVHVLLPGEYQSEAAFTPTYLVPGSGPGDAPLMGNTEHDVAAFFDWARDHGAVDGQDQTMRIELRGRDERPVTIEGIRPIVVSRSAPRSGWFSYQGGCGGVEIREADIDFDRTPPTIKFSNVDPNDPGREVLAFTRRVSSTDNEVVNVHAFTKRYDVKWRLEIL
jgi:hypothetical protein